MIRDTSAQDRQLSPQRNRRKQFLWIGAGAFVVVIVLACMPTVARLLSADSSASATRLRIAEVKRGTLTRDVSVQGKVVAAVSPTVYTRTAGTVSLDVNAGDKVKKGEVLAEIDSPELTNKLKQEQATLDSLGLDVERATIDNRKAQAASQMAYEQAVIDRETAEREVQRNQKAFTMGAQAEMTVLRAKDALAKTKLSELNAQHNIKLDRDSLAFELKTKRFAFDRQKLLVEDLTRQVDELKLRSPVNGQVGQLIAQQRANVAANGPILTVVDLSALEIEVQVPEVFAHDLGLGMKA
ncbi:MAG: biotin/lipoyl-binding protein, partial [Dokdonella sp.]